jgi:hypothetical protein
MSDTSASVIEEIAKAALDRYPGTRIVAVHRRNFVRRRVADYFGSASAAEQEAMVAEILALIATRASLG